MATCNDQDFADGGDLKQVRTNLSENWHSAKNSSHKNP